MKTNIICIHGMYVIKTGLVLGYERTNLSEYERRIGDHEYSYSEEIMDVCTGKYYGFDGIIHKVGMPDNVWLEKSLFEERQNRKKRGRHSRSNNKQRSRKH